MATSSTLYLHEEILLLALRDKEGTVASGALLEYALGGALVTELLLRERISIDSTSKRKMVNVLSIEPVGVSLLDESLQRMATAKRRAALQTWVSRLAGIKWLKHRVAQRLCELGILRETEDKVLWIFTRTVYPELTHVPEQQLIERLQTAIFSDACDLDSHTAVLIALAHSAGILGNVFAKQDLKKRKQRLEQITRGDAVGQATKEAIEAMQTAIMVACIIPAVTTTVIS